MLPCAGKTYQFRAHRVLVEIFGDAGEFAEAQWIVLLLFEKMDLTTPLLFLVVTRVARVVLPHRLRDRVAKGVILASTLAQLLFICNLLV